LQAVPSAPFTWHIWDGCRDGFSALVNYHTLDRRQLEKLTYTHLGDWLKRQEDSLARDEGGAEARLLAARELQNKLKLILEGEPPYDIFVRWKPMEQQPIGWEPDLNDGVRMNIRPFLAMDIPGGKKGAEERSWCARQFWETLHIDLRMVDTSDFSISYCPTNIYSVGTPHEIIMATLQHKPVLFVSPPIVFPALRELRAHVAADPKASELLKRLEMEIPIKENPRGIPSLWYIPLVGGENFFDGFGFAPYRKRFSWKTDIAIDAHEKRFPPRRPLLPFVEKLNHRLPKKWDRKLNKFVDDDDWLLWDFHTQKIRGKHVESIRK